MSFELRFPAGSKFVHCGRECVVMRYIPELPCMGWPPTMRYEYQDATGLIRSGEVFEAEFPAIEAQNRSAAMEVS